MDQWLDKLHRTFIEKNGLEQILEGLGNTLLITAGALIIGVIIGVIIAIAKYFSEDVPALKPISWLCDIYVTVIRGIPVTVLLIISFFIVMTTVQNGIIPAIITFGINSGAYMAEIIRSGINAVDKGQMEAGRSLGLTKIQTMGKIILPQAVRYILPAIGNEFIALLKETSVAGYVAVEDLTRKGNIVSNNTFDVVNPRLFVALIYLVIVVILTQILSVVERRLKKNDKR
ncbi:MAG: amino acid ABC transporter permease [Clostridiales bacterium]|nr:amino acid ABC transporter permease [Clostridiales bacterium]